MLVAVPDLWRHAAAGALHRRRIHAASRRGRALGAGHHALHDLLRRSQQDCAPDPRHPDVVSASDRRGLRAWAAPTTAPIPPAFSTVEFYVGLKPYKDKAWKSGPIHTKEELTDSIRQQVGVLPRHHLQLHPARRRRRGRGLDRPEERAGGEVYGPDLNVLQDKALQIKEALAKVPGFTELTVVRELGQPSLLVDVDREKIARYGINVADVEAVVQAAVGGQAATQVIQGEKLFDLVVRMQPQFRSQRAARSATCWWARPTGQQIPLKPLADIRQGNGASFIYRENNSRYIGVQYSIEGRDLERAVARRAGGGAQGRRLAAGLSDGVGRRVQRVPGGASRSSRVIGPITVCADLPDPVRALRQFQVPGHHCAGRGDDRARGRAAGAEADRTRPSASPPSWACWR